jgi:hypothetical protein
MKACILERQKQLDYVADERSGGMALANGRGRNAAPEGM